MSAIGECWDLVPEGVLERALLPPTIAFVRLGVFALWVLVQPFDWIRRLREGR